MKKGKGKKALKEVERKSETRDLADIVEERMEEGAQKERTMDERQEIHVNLISAAEMKAHTKEMRSELDRKFMECLMVTGLTRAEALKHVQEWNAQWGYEYHGY